MFSETFLQQHPIRFVQGSDDVEPLDDVALPTPQEEEVVIERLRGLGYLD
jgi:hypothetical protein